MKALNKLTNVAKARLLHQLFPSEIPALLEFIQGMCRSILEEEEVNRKNWNDERFSFDEWLSLAGEVNDRIYRYGCQDNWHFSFQLFYDDAAFVTIHCLMVYTNIRQHANKKFAVAIDLLFNP